MAKILVTGGLGYIGSCTTLELLSMGHKVLIVDNLSNSKIETFEVIREYAKKSHGWVDLLLADLTIKESISKVVNKTGYNLDFIIHFAALKSVPDSVNNPVRYCENNVGSMLNTIEIARATNACIIFSSSCSVYGDAQSPFSIGQALGKAESPYAYTKQVCEQLLWYVGKIDVRSVILRYFNPVGAHKSMLVGDNCIGGTKNVVNILCDCARWNKPFTIFGDNWDTRDGTCIRDYIDINDLVNAHIKAMTYLQCEKDTLVRVFNVGTGNGNTVKELVDSFKSANHVDFPVVIGDRRSGDIESAYASTDDISNLPGFKCETPLRLSMISAYTYYQKTM